MIKVDTLPPEKLADATRKAKAWVARILSCGAGGPGPSAITMHETFSCWRPGPGFDEKPLSLERVFEPAGYWHQVFFDRAPAAFVRTELTPDGEVIVRGGSRAPAVAKIDEAVSWLDANEERFADHYVLRLLRMKGHYLHAFWLSGERPLIVPIDSETSRLKGQIRDLEAMPLEKFMQIVQEGIDRRRGRRPTMEP
ncbi:hypothetical protein WMF37_20170 [Sorangium sp. So ce291]|uniref:hypothetical protein n=1 Tax=Sorangium sp. So ce291 TaxID=3133294 RepID=UPI003F641C6D